MGYTKKTPAQVNFNKLDMEKFCSSFFLLYAFKLSLSSILLVLCHPYRNEVWHKLNMAYGITDILKLGVWTMKQQNIA